MLLRASSQEAGAEVDLRATIGSGSGGIPHGDLLVRYAEAGTRGGDDLEAVRAELLAAIGPEAFVEAAATVGIFNGLVRTADATGIPLDDGTLKASGDFRADLGLNEYAGAQSTDLARASGVEHTRDVSRLFSSS